jgi:hypothetical protein
MAAGFKLGKLGCFIANNAPLNRLILKNLVYCGKIAYGRGKTEKVLADAVVEVIVKFVSNPHYLIILQVWQL